MNCLLVLAIFGVVALAPAAFAGGALAGQVTTGASDGMPGLPAAPQGKSTVLGGRIEKLDPVRDQFSLAVYGARPIKIFFDARTQFYRDGKKIAAGELRMDEHASVETVLDGTNIFALSIHTLSQAPEGVYQGQLLRYNPGTRELAISSGLSHEPLTLLVPAGTPIVHQGQADSTSTRGINPDLTPGSLISVEFVSDNQGHGVARRIAVLTTPGSVFVFRGNISSLDLHSGTMVLADPQDDKTYQVSFDPGRFPLIRSLHQGDHVSATASFDGTHYVATAITVE